MLSRLGLLVALFTASSFAMDAPKKQTLWFEDNSCQSPSLKFYTPFFDVVDENSSFPWPAPMNSQYAKAADISPIPGQLLSFCLLDGIDYFVSTADTTLKYLEKAPLPFTATKSKFLPFWADAFTYAYFDAKPHLNKIVTTNQQCQTGGKFPQTCYRLPPGGDGTWFYAHDPSRDH